MNGAGGAGATSVTGAGATRTALAPGFSNVTSNVGGPGGGAGTGGGGGAAAAVGAITMLMASPVATPERSNVTVLPSLLSAPAAATPPGL